MKKMTYKIIIVFILLFWEKVFADCVNPDPVNFWTWEIKFVDNSPDSITCSYYPLYSIMSLDTLNMILMIENGIMWAFYIFIFFIWLTR